jgi:predicted hotdog family 3-hydroxylacyl-ACP dehydratase
VSSAVPIEREQLLSLVPHAGGMCLLDRVLAHDEQEIRCSSRSHRDPANPLRRANQLSALHLAEYAAQAMAIHGALGAGGRPQPGMLAALRDIRLHVDHIHAIEGELIVQARRRLAQHDGSLYEFTVTAGGKLLCEGRIAIALVIAAA